MISKYTQQVKIEITSNIKKMSFTIASLLGFDNTKPIQTKSIATENKEVYVVDRFQPSSKCFSWSQLEGTSKHTNTNNNNHKNGNRLMKRCFDEEESIDEDIDVVKCFTRTKGDYIFIFFHDFKKNY